MTQVEHPAAFALANTIITAAAAAAAPPVARAAPVAGAATPARPAGIPAAPVADPFGPVFQQATAWGVARYRSTLGWFFPHPNLVHEPGHVDFKIEEYVLFLKMLCNILSYVRGYPRPNDGT